MKAARSPRIPSPAHRARLVLSVALPLAAALATPALADPAAHAQCKRIRADLVEVSATEGCNPGLGSCFLGEVDGNHGLNGTTHFKSDSAATGPSTSPGFISYGGAFEYRTAHGTLFMRETGVTDPAVVTAYQRIDHGSGRFEGASGHFFVSGTKSGDGVITTEVTGELCLARGRH
ncbi:hypothetical protein [Marilutibacter chinensis]|uniref:Uncharacterized protein n=1 Tax=Marilutibacter chinensis TaxID=2912247 RepID=A0ABS9HUV5_9GAMM|nr:hypothetical protein [Lysobacter chinensis]MCF7221887.1 hypothetical protein [Lysobacter chinensis]